MLSLQPCEVCCYVVFCRVQPIFNHHYKITYLCQITTTTNYVIYLFRVRVSFAVCCWGGLIRTTFAPCAVFVPGSVRYVWILFKCGYILYMLLVLFSLLCSGMSFWISCTTLIGHYIGSVLSLYVADFLLECSVFPILFAFRTIF